jgi:hypothetical protein
LSSFNLSHSFRSDVSHFLQHGGITDLLEGIPGKGVFITDGSVSAVLT